VVHYRRIVSLQEYLLLSQTEPRIGGTGEGEWRLNEAVGLDGNVHLDSIQCTLLLSDVYDRAL
jgi:hypothetical protein